MFGFSKKIDPSATNKAENSSASVMDEQEKEMGERMAKEIAVHAMPERFRLDNTKVDEAKTTGILVMVAGFIFIILVGILVYIFVFKAPKDREMLTVGEITESESGSPTDVLLEEGKNNSLLGTIDNNSTDSLNATSTVDSGLEEEATSTPSQIDLDKIDEDYDGLNADEELLLGTSDDNIDSDNDGYTDPGELSSLYNPAGEGKMSENSNIGKYNNQTFAYSLYYPLDWVRTSVGGNDSIMFKLEDNNFVQVVAQPNVGKQTIEDWYQEQFNQEAFLEKIEGKDWQALRQPEGEGGGVVYLADNFKNYIFSLSYSADAEGNFPYKNIFLMMIKSFEITE